MPAAICRVPNGIRPAVMMGTITRIKMVVFDILNSGHTAKRLALSRQAPRVDGIYLLPGYDRKWWVYCRSNAIEPFRAGQISTKLLFLDFRKDREVEQKMCASWLVGYDRQMALEPFVLASPVIFPIRRCRRTGVVSHLAVSRRAPRLRFSKNAAGPGRQHLPSSIYFSK